MTVYDPESRVSPDSESAGDLFLDFIASGTVRNKLLLLISYSVPGILLKQAERTKTVYNTSIIWFSLGCVCLPPIVIVL